jgi:hypothetical protein
MAFSTGFFDGDTEYGQTEFNRYFENLYESGVSLDSSGDMTFKVTADSGSTITIGEGFAIVKGFFLNNDSDYSISLTADANYSRIDRVVIQLNTTSGTITPTVITGTAGSTPTAPSLTRTETVYEISLAQVLITKSGTITVTDERFDTELCGAIRPRNITELKAMTAEYEKQFNEWFASLSSKAWRNVYVQADEPTDMVKGSIWIQEL